MLRLLARAQRFSTMVMRGDGKTVAELAKEVGVTASYFTRILRLRFLAPEAVKAILSDRHPRKLTGKRLSVHTKLPHAWSEQLALLGIS
jgi:site-specific DNA recombinase